MTVQEAYIQIDTAIEKYVPQLQELGLVVKKRIFYTDKNLVQMQEFTDKSARPRSAWKRSRGM